MTRNLNDSRTLNITRLRNSGTRNLSSTDSVIRWSRSFFLFLAILNPSGVHGQSEQGVIRLTAGDVVSAEFSAGPLPRTEDVIADAPLNDLCHVGSDCWAVGERGVVLHSEDGGMTWSSAVLPFDCSLRRVSFLTNKIGWIAGLTRSAGPEPSVVAVLLQTRDGGSTWIDLRVSPDADDTNSDDNNQGGVGAQGEIPTRKLPGILDLTCFGLEKAVAVTVPMPERNGATLFQTTDGGNFWLPVPCDDDQIRMTVAAFLSEDEGIAAGERLASATLVSGQAVTTAHPTKTLRQIRGISADRAGTAWMAGDGAFALRSRDGGVTWVPADFGLSVRLDRLCDFRTVTHHGTVVLMGGSPGSVLIRSEDSGTTWSLIPTGITGEIRRLRFVTDQTVLAAAAIGTILRSDDAGLSWTVVRGINHRAGLLNLVTDTKHASWEALASLTADSGVRTVVAQLSPTLPGPGQSRGSLESALDAQTFSELGVSNVAREWLFAGSSPDHYLESSRLMADWNRQTDGQLRTLLPLRLAAVIRTWRPTAILVDAVCDEDAVAGITREVLPLAIRLAAAAPGESEELDTASLDAIHLPSWQVRRAAIRSASGTTSALAWSRADLLPRLKSTSGLLLGAVHAGQSEATDDRTADDSGRPESDRRGRICYEVLEVSPDDAKKNTHSDLFHGCSLQPGGDARRMILIPAPEELQRLRSVVLQVQREAAVLQDQQRNSATQNALIGELQNVGSELPPALALRQLTELAEQQLQANAVETWLSVLQEIIRRFPRSPQAAEAAENLFAAYSSVEVRRYLLNIIEERGKNSGRIPGVTKLAEETAGDPTDQPSAGVFPGGQQTTPVIQQASGMTLRKDSVDQTAAMMKNWDLQAAQSLEILRPLSSEGISSAVLMRLAANARSADRTGEQSTLLAELTARGAEWASRAAAENESEFSAATPTFPVIKAEKSPTRPVLDGVLTDACWEKAAETFLLPEEETTGGAKQGSLLLLAWDQEFLYIAGRMKHPASGPAPSPVVLDRDYDQADIVSDRVELEFDIDRDYSTAFCFRISQNGQTSERCWQLQNWNPRWYVASASDQDVWRFEAAIPLDQLLIRRIEAGMLWGIRFQRIVPGYTRETLRQADAASAADRSGRGHLRFIRNQRR